VAQSVLDLFEDIFDNAVATYAIAGSAIATSFAVLAF